MKIAIKANPSRGKEIISLLENLGGINKRNWNGDGNIDTYYIDKNNIIQYDRAPADYKLYTLEEFEKLTAYKEMKAKRIVTITLEKAKEWYKKGGELREIALQAFTEKELTKVELPKTWEEFCANYPVKESEAMIGCDACIINCVGIEGKRSYKFKDIIPSKKSAEAHLALIQLEQLRNCWWGDWRPEWNDYHKDAIINLRGEITVIGCSTVATFLVFPNRKMAKEFLECFRDLIETAKDLI